MSDFNMYERGLVVWATTEEDGGPDVGMTLGLGAGEALWFGEMPNSTLADADIDPKVTGDGWWIAMYREGGDTEIVGLIHDTEAARELFDSLARAIKAIP